MFRLARFLTSLLFVVVVLWFATNVQLGKRTLWGHLRAIFASQEAKDLAEGTKEEAKKVADKVRDELARDGGSDGESHRAHAPLDPVDAKDQKSLDKLVHEKTRPGKR
jgi:hypothetical protein